jgi:hypothetical protein
LDERRAFRLHFPTSPASGRLSIPSLAVECVVMTQVRRGNVAGLLVLLVAMAACGSKDDPRLQQLTVGISKDSVISIMGGEPPSRVDPYLVSGDYLEAMLFTRPGMESAGGDTIADRDRTPVVLINGTVGGWGWAYWDSLATAHSIPLSPTP